MKSVTSSKMSCLVLLVAAGFALAPEAKAQCAFKSLTLNTSFFAVSGTAYLVLPPAAPVGTFTLNFTGTGCSWSVAPTAAFISMQGPTSGTANTTSQLISFGLSANSGSGLRSAQITVTVNGSAATPLDIFQNSPSCPAPTLTPSSISLPASGGSGTFTVAAAGCWYAQNAVSAGVSYTNPGYGTVNYIVGANTGAARIGFIDFDVPAVSRFTINQAGSTLPTISSLTPNGAHVGDAGFTLTVIGGNFNTGSAVSWNGTTLPTTFVNSGRLTATVDKSLLARAGPVQITVSNGQNSVSANFALADLIRMNGTVGVPYSYDLSRDDVSLFTNNVVSPATPYLSASGLPPGLILGTSGVLSGTPTTAGTYQVSYRVGGVTVSGVTIIIAPFAGTQTISFGATGLRFAFVNTATSPQTQLVNVTNRTVASQTLTATGTVLSGQNWLTVLVPSRTIAPFADAPVVVSVDPSKFNRLPGVYTGSVTMSASPSGQSVTIPVVVSVTAGTSVISLSQTAQYFETVAGGANPQFQGIRVIGPTASATVTTRSTAATAPVAQIINNGTPGTISVGFNTSNSPAGIYYYQVKVVAPNVDNSPQFVTAVVRVLPSASPIKAVLNTNGIVFVGRLGATSPSQQFYSLDYVKTTALTFTTSSTFDASGKFASGGNWLTVTPSQSTVAANQSRLLGFQPDITRISAAGVYKADVAVRFVEDGQVQHVAVLFVVLPVTAADPILTRTGNDNIRGADACTPTTLYPVFTKLGIGFTVPTGWPAAVGVTVVDDCGNYQTGGTVSASFTNGDPPISLLSLGDGTWSATWQPQGGASQTTITVRAQLLTPAISGTETLGGDTQTNSGVPAVDVGGVVSAASNAAFQPLAPGSFTSIYGNGLSNALVEAKANPYETTLAATQVFLGDRELPLKFVFDRQINAIIPYDVPLNSTQQLIVVNGDAVSIPQPIVITAAQPALFTKDLSGKGEGIIVGVKADQSRGFIISPSDRVTAGDFLVIYVAGLGAVDNPVAPGAPAPNSPLSRTINPVTVSIGGRDVRVDFAGLAPGFPGVYQVNALVPAGIPSGTNVELVVTSAGKSSTPVTISIQ